LNPADYELTLAPTQALKGGDVAENAAILTQVLQGSGTPAQQDVVALNAALALQVAGVAPDWRAGIAQAREILARGAAWDRLQQLVHFLKA
jgi:anthranilate phosphoribosyltransferase